jgi:hypothetical protein
MLFLSTGFLNAQESRPADNCTNFKSCDKNQDKFINQNECQFASFQQFDKNNDGKLSRKEHRKLLKYEKKMKAEYQFNQQQQNQKMNPAPKVNQQQKASKQQGKRNH